MENKYPTWLESSAFILLLLNIPLIILETFPSIAGSFPVHTIEWVFTALFTFEFLIRIIIAQSKKGYLFSFGALIDLISLLPQYLLLVFPLAHDLFLLRLLRLFRLLVKGFRAASTGRRVLENALALKQHFAPNEVVVLQENMSRKHFLREYFIYIVLMAGFAACAILIESPHVWGIPVYAAIFYLLLVGIAVLLVRREFFVVSHRYALTNYRILSSTQVLEQHVTSVSLLQVTDIALHQTFLERLLNTGTVIVRTSGEVNSMELIGIRNPVEIKQQIHKTIMSLNGQAAENRATNT